MKGLTAIVGAIALIVGVVVGKFLIPSGGEGMQVAETPAAEPSAPAPLAAAGGDKPVRFKMASSFPGELVQLGDQGRRLEQRIKALSEGNMEFKFYEPGALVPALEIFDAVSSGSIDAGWTASGYWAGKIPALQFFTAVPFGPYAGETVAWLFYGGGADLWEELYKPHNILSMPCNLLAPEGSGWFRNEINSVEDLKGLKMRFFGLGAKVMEKLGVSTQLLAGGDIFPALELGTIDATEYSMPAIDLDLGFHQVAKHYYFPGWHQPTSVGELMINLDKWNGMTTHQQEIVRSACKENMLNGLAQGEAIQFKALQELQSKGVILHRWSPEILDALRTAWGEVVAQEAANDKDFARVWASLSEFRDGYKLWAEYGNM